MREDMDEICRDIDSLLIRGLELMEEKASLTVEMERAMREGHIDLAKAKYIRGKESVSILQVPNGSEVTPLFDLETKSEETGNDLSFDVSLKTSQQDDPIKWFGVLVPRNLRSAQKRFQDSVYLAVNAANVQNSLDSISKKLRDLYLLKSSVDVN